MELDRALVKHFPPYSISDSSDWVDTEIGKYSRSQTGASSRTFKLQWYPGVPESSVYCGRERFSAKIFDKQLKLAEKRVSMLPVDILCPQCSSSFPRDSIE